MPRLFEHQLLLPCSFLVFFLIGRDKYQVLPVERCFFMPTRARTFLPKANYHRVAVVSSRIDYKLSSKGKLLVLFGNIFIETYEW